MRCCYCQYRVIEVSPDVWVCEFCAHTFEGCEVDDLLPDMDAEASWRLNPYD